MTLEDLMNIFERAVAKAAPFPQHHEDGIYEGIRAVVEALRDEMTLGWEDCRPWGDVSDVNKFMNKILASDGVEAAGASTREDEVGARTPPGSPAAAPDEVCEWTPISEVDGITHYSTVHCVTNDSIRWRTRDECVFCGKPIKFKEAAP
ncbi:MAG: hypothetical protein E6Q97_32525 [Desulfurellales bacterium]|nr:MAG: hypothetical protein E6Q97_32525 [Desulfurellales bacterium]